MCRVEQGQVLSMQQRELRVVTVGHDGSRSASRGLRVAVLRDVRTGEECVCAVQVIKALVHMGLAQLRNAEQGG